MKIKEKEREFILEMTETERREMITSISKIKERCATCTNETFDTFLEALRSMNEL